ncbi:MAG TPA: hypothetical protein VN828_04630 [Acidobacteriaceae bacterium]|jgi:hypothetical protein|nr:hypothetical protein [Acidobacteriaceae bacterium]
MRKDINAFSKRFALKDEQGAKVAVALGGTIFTVSDGRQIATLRGGSVYGMDGQLLGRLTPSGVVLREDATYSQAFLRLVAP